MAYADLSEFVAALERAGELRRVTSEVDPILEITEVTDRVSKAGGPALLFEHVKGSSMPVLINLFGSPTRMNLALQVTSPGDLAAELQDVLDLKAPEGLLDKLRMFPKLVKDGPCKEVVVRDNPSLAGIPILQCWPIDAGRCPMVFTKDPETGVRNCGTYRMQVFDERTTGMHWHVQKGGGAHYRKAKRRGRRVEVGVAIGADPDPAVCFAATLPLPEEIDEMLVAGFIRKQPVELVKCETVDVEVPANAEIVLEGVRGHRSVAHRRPLRRPHRLLLPGGPIPRLPPDLSDPPEEPDLPHHRGGAPPRMEDCHMAAAIEALFLPIMKKQLPEIVDFHLPFEGIFHNLALVSIDKQYPGHARKVMHALWGLGRAMVTKRKWPEEGFTRPWPDEIVMDEAGERPLERVRAGLSKPLGATCRRADITRHWIITHPHHPRQTD